jgi:putative membrane protein
MLKTFVIQAIAAAIAVLVAAKIMPGVRIRKTETAVGIAVAFAILNLLVGWLLKAVLAVVLLPAAILTLGLPYLVLGLVVNVILLYITDKLIDDFEVTGFWPLVGTAGLISIAAWLLPRIF